VSSEGRARLFVALELPPEVRDELASWSAGVLRDVAELRLVGPEHLHVTLCFLGGQEVEQIGSIAEACRRAGSAGAVRLKLQATLSSSLQAGGWYVPEKRPFLAHVTVARVRSGSRIRPGSPPAPASLRFEGSFLTLFRSHLARGGARYEPVARIGLDPG
jgi:2'-5' RNA ligase